MLVIDYRKQNRFKPNLRWVWELYLNSLTFLLIVSPISAICQAPEIIWNHGYGGNLDDRGKQVINGIGGGYLVIGHGESIDGDLIGSNGSDDCFVVKTDANGVKFWSKGFGGSEYDIGHVGSLTLDSGYVICASILSNDGDVTENNGIQDLWAFKINDDGDIEWQYNYGGTHNETPHSVIPTDDGG